MGSGAVLYERLGGEAAVEAAVVRFYRKVAADPELARFFDGFDLPDQMQKHIAFMIRVFGGPTERQEPDLGRVHAKLVARGLGGRHVDAFVRILGEVLTELEVPPQDIAEVLVSLEGSRARVLGGPNRGPDGGGQAGGGAGGGGAGPLAFDQVIVTHDGTERAYSPAEFLALPLGKRVTFVVQNMARFFCGDQPVSADAALADARKRRVASLA
jgi:hemoglobin